MRPLLDSRLDRLRYVDLHLERDCRPVPDFPLPAGFRFVFYQPGDRAAWLAIERSAGEILDETEGAEAWAEYFGSWENRLSAQILFVEDASGEKVATATAWFHPEISASEGVLHWVAVRRPDQGKGLARPLIARTLDLLRSFGLDRIQLHTQTTTWLAVMLYLDFGFRPTAENARTGREGYQILRTLTEHPALADFPPLPENSLWDPATVAVEEFLKNRYGSLPPCKVWQTGPKKRYRFLQEGVLWEGTYQFSSDGAVVLAEPLILS